MSNTQTNPHRSCAGHDGEMSCATLLAAINDDRLTNLDKCIVGHILNGFRTRAALATKAKCAPTSIPRSLKRLEACGYVTWTRGGGRGKASEFTVIENCNRNPEATVLNRRPEVMETPKATVSAPNRNPEATETSEIRSPEATVSAVHAQSVFNPGAGAGAKTSNILDTYTTTQYNLQTPVHGGDRGLGKEPSDLFGGEEKPAARKRNAYDPAFNELWLSWPAQRRERSDKPMAFKRWKAGVDQFGAERIAKAAARYLSLPDTRKDGFRYCCLVEVFMNGKLEAAVEAANDPVTRNHEQQRRPSQRAIPRMVYQG